MAMTKVLVATLLSYLAIASIGGNAEALLPAEDTGLTSYLFSVEVLLDESADPVPLGIRDGQTVAQAAEGFCLEHGLDEAMQTVLMPQLVGVLENGIAEAIGDASPVGDETPDHATSAAARDTGMSSTSVEPLFTLGISLDGKEERTLSYYTGQGPGDVASAFCVENLDPSSHSEAFTRCSETLSASIIERIGAANLSPSHNAQTTEQQQQHQEQRQGQASVQGGEEEGGDVVGDGDGDVVPKPLLTVPLNINGIETTLKMYEGSGAEGVAHEFCHREEFAFEGQSLNSCYSQIVEIAVRAITVYNSQESGELSGQAGADPFTFKVPVTLAGLLLHAEYRTSETPRVSALRFCGPNLPAIESALGIDNTEEVAGHDDDAVVGDVAASGGGAGAGSLTDGRESLKEACAMVVEDAINAVLVGLRERVLEAEIAQANATESLYNADDWPREQIVEEAVKGEGGLDGVLASLETTAAVTDATT